MDPTAQPCFLLDLPTEIRYKILDLIIPAGPVFLRYGRISGYATAGALLRVHSIINADMRKLLFDTKKRFSPVRMARDCIETVSFYQNHTDVPSFDPPRYWETHHVVVLRPGSLSHWKFVVIDVECEARDDGTSDDDWHLPLVEMLIRAVRAFGSTHQSNSDNKPSNLTICLTIRGDLDKLDYHLCLASLLVRCCRWLNVRGVDIKWEFKITSKFESEDSSDTDADTNYSDSDDSDDQSESVVEWTNSDNLSFSGREVTPEMQVEVAKTIKRYLPPDISTTPLPQHLMRVSNAFWLGFDTLYRLSLLLEPHGQIQRYLPTWARSRRREHTSYDEVGHIIDMGRRALFNRDAAGLVELLEKLRRLAAGLVEQYPDVAGDALKHCLQDAAVVDSIASSTNTLADDAAPAEHDELDEAVPDDENWYSNDYQGFYKRREYITNSRKGDYLNLGYEESSSAVLPVLRWPMPNPPFLFRSKNIVDEVWYKAKKDGKTVYRLITPDCLEINES